jgi:glycosyltransferase involved in cell wall biosynthesis
VSSVVVLIPAYEPDRRLIDLVNRLGHHRIIVVDDGSGAAYAAVFARVRDLGAEVITVAHNRGKGHALKVGFAYVRSHLPGHDVVCADSDGQHSPEDIEAVADRLAATDAAMVLGARRFTGQVPARSRFGNAVTRTAYRLATGRALLDTQTGLRGYPARMLGWLGEVGGEKFEYELRLLLRAAREGLHVEEVEIATIYLAGNASSHFRPLRDSARIYGRLLAFSASSLLAFAVDAVLLLTLATLTDSLAGAAIVARLVSATMNYQINRAWVFGSRYGLAPAATSARRYAALALTVLVANVILLEALTVLTGSVVAAKAMTEVSLFAASFVAQKYVVFPRRAAASQRNLRPIPAAAPREPVAGVAVPR